MARINMALPRWWLALLYTLLIPRYNVLAIQVDLTSDSSVKSALSTIAYDLMSIYTGNLSTSYIPGLLPYLSPTNGERYYWWETGAMMGTMIDYWYYTGDTTYNSEVMASIISQESSAADFEPPAQTADLGNDDQAFWAMTAMEAAEYNFPNPPSDQPQWLELVQAVFNRQATRWDTSTCGGGLRWQVVFLNSGYKYKNSGSNGAFFQIAARLAKYTGNSTYSDWAEKTFDWMTAIGLINTSDWLVGDGKYTETNCTTGVDYVWTYNSAMLVYGSAVMWNITNSTNWYDRTQSLIGGMKVFFPNNIMFEYECETNEICNNDQQSFKAYCARWLAATTLVAPWTYDLLHTWLSTSAAAAAASCTGGSSGTLCGLTWTKSTYDGITGAGEEMAALEVIGSGLMYGMKGPVTEKTGGTSKGNPSAGSAPPLELPGLITRPITAGDRAGAAILSILFSSLFIAGTAWIIL